MQSGYIVKIDVRKFDAVAAPWLVDSGIGGITFCQMEHALALMVIVAVSLLQVIWVRLFYMVIIAFFVAIITDLRAFWWQGWLTWVPP